VVVVLSLVNAGFVGGQQAVSAAEAKARGAAAMRTITIMMPVRYNEKPASLPPSVRSEQVR